MDKKIGIVMTYFKRRFQLGMTLYSMKHYNPNDFFVIIVDDGSGSPINLIKWGIDVEVITLAPHEEWRDSSIAFNTGFKRAIDRGAEKIIIQNAECKHNGDILAEVKAMKPDEYISFGCYSLNYDDTCRVDVKINNVGASKDGESAWYNHPSYRPVGYHFCSAITTENLVKLNGFDERFSDGIGYDDDYFIHRVKCLGLNVRLTSYPFVFHQWHYSVPKNRPELIIKNKVLIESLTPAMEYKAKHIYTPDL